MQNEAKDKRNIVSEDGERQLSQENLQSLKQRFIQTPPAEPAPQTPAAPEMKIIAQHKVSDSDTLSHIALKYYGSAAEVYWRFIYEFNKEVIGERPNILRPGIVLNIPEKPQDK